MFLRLQQLDDDNSELRSCVPCLRANIERLEEVNRNTSNLLYSASICPSDPLSLSEVVSNLSSCFHLKEKRKLQDEVESVSDRLQEETESRRKIADKLSHERHQHQKEKESTQEVGLLCLAEKERVRFVKYNTGAKTLTLLLSCTVFSSV